MRLSSREISLVFRINYAGRHGTAFVHFGDGHCALASAAHILQGAHVGDKILIQTNSGWVPLEIADIAFDANSRDVCALSVLGLMVDVLQQPYPSPQMALGCDIRFVGFPHELVNTFPGDNFPVPLVRSANFSGVISVKGQDMMILDGFNNPGYSGGPVFAQTKDGSAALAGVISGYRYEKPSHGKVYRRLPDGSEEEIADTFVKANSGMIQVVPRGALHDAVGRLNIYLSYQHSNQGPSSASLHQG